MTYASASAPPPTSRAVTAGSLGLKPNASSASTTRLPAAWPTFRDEKGTEQKGDPECSAAATIQKGTTRTAALLRV